MNENTQSVMNRRQYLSGVGGLVLLSGCMERIQENRDNDCEGEYDMSTRTRPCPRLTHQPTKPTIGQNVIFDASETLSPPDRVGVSQTLYYFWRVGDNTELKLPEGAKYAAKGPQFTHQFKNGGRHSVEVLITHGNNVIRDEDYFPHVGVGYEHDEDVARASEIVNVQKLSQEPIELSNEQINIDLKADKQAAPVDEAVPLILSITNLVGGGQTTAQLILDVPTGLRVNQTSFNQGGGQFTSTYNISPGKTINETISLTANEPGPYRITGYIVYTIKQSNKTNQTQNSDIQLRFY